MTFEKEEEIKERSSYKIMMDWVNHPDQSLRLGQYFCNTYMTNAWPELYYEEKEAIAFIHIHKWLIDHHYEYDMPPPRKV